MGRSGTGLEGVFSAVLVSASACVTFLRRVRMRYCKDADASHRRRWRLFAHSGHVRGRVCFARAAAQELTPSEMVGMSAHELGHVVADKLGLPAHVQSRYSRGKETPQSVQDEADWVARHLFGIPIRYNKRTLQELDLDGRAG